MKRTVIVMILLLSAGALLAHPHFQKQVIVDLPAAKATISYGTTPANEAHIANIEVGIFTTPRGPRLNLSADIMAGSVTIPAGDYTIGVVRKSENDWVMALFPGRLGRGETPAPDQLIELESMFSDKEGMADHMLLDITPGHGKFEGRAVLTLKFGTLTCAGALT